jgi:integrase
LWALAFVCRSRSSARAHTSRERDREYEWRERTRDLFRDIVILMRDTGMRNQRELYRMRIENLDWESRMIFVPDSKTPEGRRLVPMSRRVFDLLHARCGARMEGLVFPSKRSASGHLCSIDPRKPGTKDWD